MNVPIWMLAAAGVALAYLGAIGAVTLGAFYYSRPDWMRR